MRLPGRNAAVGMLIAGLFLASCGPGAATARQPAVAKSEPPTPEHTPLPSQQAEAITATPTPILSTPYGRVFLPHAPVQQSFSASCEAAAAALAMRIAGHPATEGDVIAAMATDPRAPELSGGIVVRWGNPSKAFVGDQDGWWPWARYDPGHPTGYGAHAPPVLDALHRLGAPNAHGGTGISLDTLKETIRSRHPVVIWLPSRHDFERLSDPLATATWTAWDGTTVTYALHEHAQTLLGADEGGFYVGTPDYQWTPGYPFLSYWTNAEFARAFAFLGSMAIIVE